MIIIISASQVVRAFTATASRGEEKGARSLVRLFGPHGGGTKHIHLGCVCWSFRAASQSARLERARIKLCNSSHRRRQPSRFCSARETWNSLRLRRVVDVGLSLPLVDAMRSLAGGKPLALALAGGAVDQCGAGAVCAAAAAHLAALRRCPSRSLFQQFERQEGKAAHFRNGGTQLRSLLHHPKQSAPTSISRTKWSVSCCHRRPEPILYSPAWPTCLLHLPAYPG